MYAAVLMIQRVYRGYVARERCRVMKFRKDLESMYRYFQGLKMEIYREKGMKILMNWRKFRFGRRVKNRIEAKKQAIEETETPSGPSKWDFKPILKKHENQRLRPAFIKTNPSWKTKVNPQEPSTPNLFRRNSYEPNSPSFKRLRQINNRSSIRSSNSSTEPSTPMSSGVERGKGGKVQVAGLDSIAEGLDDM